MDKILKSEQIHPWEADEHLQKLTVPEYLLEKARCHAGQEDSVILVSAESGEEIRLSQIEKLTSNVASWFYAHGMKRSDVVIYMNRDYLRQSVFHIGIWRANGVVRASYPQDLPETLEERLRESRVKWVFCELMDVETCRKAVEKVEWKVTIIVNGEAAQNCVSLDELLTHQGEVPPLEITPKDTAMILLTSGTSGPPKGAVRTHERLLCLLINATTVGWVDRTLFLASAAHISGSTIGLTAIALGVTTICMWNPQPEKILQAVHKYKAQEIFGFPSFIINAAAHPSRHEYDLSSVKYVFTVGTVITPTIYNTIKEEYNATVLTVFGLTESLYNTSYAKLKDKNTLELLFERKEYQVGKPQPGVQLRFADTETGESLGPNKVGEVQIKALETITEYLNDPKKTKEAFTLDGFFKTGDVGSYDETGVVSIFGRSKEVFKCYNNHISPNFIDGIIGDHPAVLEVCTIGVPDSDGCNFVPRVFLAFKPGMKVSKEEILAFAHGKLPDYMHLRGGLYFVNALPRGNTGKVTRNLVAQLTPE